MARADRAKFLDPDYALKKAAAEREAMRQTGNWGVNPDTVSRAQSQPEAYDMAQDHRKRVTRLERCLVFDALFRKSVIDQNQQNAGRAIVELYAKAHGMDGSRGMRAEFVDNDRGDSKGRLDIQMAAARRYDEIKAHIGGGSAKLIEALCHDWIMDTGRSWQDAVRSVYTVRDEKKLSAFIVSAVENVRFAFEAGL
ncbi:hypothetical protein [Asticcacaulis endophyticus]|uniref:Uncharacterized protein n=1 Tax=Asticcacaulis endophyticus TaxID=1395890 RepID=A0A918UN25_9CAUL|nr:hypothetical protein [Asticcacaulis endophyticus]GGZ21826.1 hypothetical protein GCM10011273_03260 [Asticcacaulis endophyticus]